jgi:hypothetical protein
MTSNQLTIEQLNFLKSHDIDLNQIFNAKGWKTAAYKDLMSKRKLLVAFNVTPCLYGHTLRLRSGHCAQCNPASIGFLKRYDSSGYMYIAESKHQELMKVGFAKNYSKREKSLRSTYYGNISDWKIICVFYSKSAGNIESNLKSKLKDFSVIKSYVHDDKILETSELYKCDLDTIVITIKKVSLEKGFEIKRIK